MNISDVVVKNPHHEETPIRYSDGSLIPPEERERRSYMGTFSSPGATCRRWFDARAGRPILRAPEKTCDLEARVSILFAS